MSTAPTARSSRIWIIWLGVLLTVVMVVMMLALWLLPRWMPDLVIAHAPWPEPALRAWRLAVEADESTEIQGAMEERLLDWGPDIGPALRYQFENGDEQCRLRVVALASEVARADGIKADTTLPDELRQSFSDDGIACLREDLVQLVLAAMADGSSYLPSNASYVAMSLHDPRTVPPACAFLVKQKPPVFEDLEPVIRFLGAMRDPRAVPAMIPLLPIRHRAHPVVEEALHHCIDWSSLPHVLAATTHAHPVIREWAANQGWAYRESPAMVERLITLIDDPERRVRMVAIGYLSTLRQAHARITAIARDETEDLPVRVRAVSGLGDLNDWDYLQNLVTSPQRELQLEAIGVLGVFRHAEAIPRLIPLLQSSDQELVRSVRHALSEMPLTDVQRQQVDAARVAQPVPTP